jgi:hypothetical protein
MTVRWKLVVTINTGDISDPYYDLCCYADEIVLHHKFCLCLVVMATRVCPPLPWEMCVSTPHQAHCSHVLYLYCCMRVCQKSDVSV